ncbi:unnamed protein product [Amoebophrya sp. A120]|nr:unnamed protein product [Amoebophrya sp. A120]|eukprot:GSA120T00022375001.1
MLSGIVKGKPRFQPGTVIVGGLSAYNRGVYPFPDLVPDVKQEDFVEDRDAWHWYYDPRKGGREWTWNHDAWEKMLSKVVKHVNKVVKEEEHRVNNKFVKENNKLQTQQTSPLTKVKKDESTPVFPRSPGIVGLYDQAIALWPENAPTYEKAKTLFKNDKSAWETTGEKEKFLDLVGKLEEQKTSTAGAPAPTSGEQALVQQVVSSCSGTPGMKKFCRCPEAEKRYGDGVSHWYFNEQEGEWEWTWNQEEWSRMLEGIEKGKPFFKPGAVIVGGLSAASKIPFVSPVPDLVVEDRDAWHWYYDAQKGEWEWTWNHEAWEKFLSKVLKEKALKSFANRMQSGLALPREEPLVLKKKSQNKVR